MIPQLTDVYTAATAALPAIREEIIGRIKAGDDAHETTVSMYRELGLVIGMQMELMFKLMVSANTIAGLDADTAVGDAVRDMELSLTNKIRGLAAAQKEKANG